MSLHTKLRSSAVAVAAVAVLGLFSTNAVASSPTADDLEPGTAGSTAILPDGTEVVFPKDFADMSVAELAEIGIVPGMGETGEASVGDPSEIPAFGGDGVAIALADDGGVITPMDASGCTADFVCQQLQAQGGSGRTIIGWYSWVLRFPTTGTTYAAWWEGQRIVGTTNSVSVRAGQDTSLAVKGGLPKTYANNTTLCTTWAGVAGKPCHTVHS